jgi:hypothetical protein
VRVGGEGSCREHEVRLAILSEVHHVALLAW